MKKQIMFSEIVTDLEIINDDLTVISLQSIDENSDAELFFYKNLDEKYLGRDVDVISKQSDNNGYIEQSIKSADDSENIIMSSCLVKKINQNYKRLVI